MVSFLFCRQLGLKSTSAANLADILKFGIEALLGSSDSSLEDTDLDLMLGPTVDGKWAESAAVKPADNPKDKQADSAEEAKAEDRDIPETAVAPTESLAVERIDSESDAETDAGDDNIYVFMGEDYSKQQKKADDTALQRLVLRDCVCE
jgi:hypothetical protein